MHTDMRTIPREPKNSYKLLHSSKGSWVQMDIGCQCCLPWLFQFQLYSQPSQLNWGLFCYRLDKWDATIQPQVASGIRGWERLCNAVPNLLKRSTGEHKSAIKVSQVQDLTGLNNASCKLHLISFPRAPCFSC